MVTVTTKYFSSRSFAKTLQSSKWKSRFGAPCSIGFGFNSPGRPTRLHRHLSHDSCGAWNAILILATPSPDLFNANSRPTWFRKALPPASPVSSARDDQITLWTRPRQVKFTARSKSGRKTPRTASESAFIYQGAGARVGKKFALSDVASDTGRIVVSHWLAVWLTGQMNNTPYFQ